MTNCASNSPPAAIAQLQQAWNTHDINAMTACLHLDYESIHPLNPDRNFWGRAAAELSWAATFEAVPDLQADLLRYTTTGETVWTEWRWSGSHVNGNAFNAGGVIIFGLAGGQILWAHVYTEIAPVIGPDWEAVLEDALRATEVSMQ